MSNPRTGSGRRLNREWKVGASHSLYHRLGKWYHVLERFPGALFDPNGYVRFETREDLLRCAEVSVTQHMHVPLGISQMQSYVRMMPSAK